MNEHYDRRRIRDILAALFVTAVLAGGLWALWATETPAKRAEPDPPKTWEELTPEIPECDEPLWERVRFRCRGRG